MMYRRLKWSSWLVDWASGADASCFLNDNYVFLGVSISGGASGGLPRSFIKHKYSNEIRLEAITVLE
jgi:hypothetical protein